MFSTLILIAAAQAATQAAPQAATATEPKADKQVCRLEHEVYSRIPRRICRPQSEWEQMAKETEDDLRSSRNDRGIAPND